MTHLHPPEYCLFTPCDEGKCGCKEWRQQQTERDAQAMTEYGLVARLRNGGQLDLADDAQELVDALRWVMSATGEGIAGAFDNAERVLSKADRGLE